MGIGLQSHRQQHEGRGRDSQIVLKPEALLSHALNGNSSRDAVCPNEQCIVHIVGHRNVRVGVRVRLISVIADVGSISGVRIVAVVVPAVISPTTTVEFAEIQLQETTKTDGKSEGTPSGRTEEFIKKLHHADVSDLSCAVTRYRLQGAVQSLDSIPSHKGKYPTVDFWNGTRGNHARVRTRTVQYLIHECREGAVPSLVLSTSSRVWLCMRDHVSQARELQFRIERRLMVWE
jgi:hypothetical protein